VYNFQWLNELRDAHGRRVHEAVLVKGRRHTIVVGLSISALFTATDAAKAASSASDQKADFPYGTPGPG
jgi:hypothetical protein